MFLQEGSKVEILTGTFGCLHFGSPESLSPCKAKLPSWQAGCRRPQIRLPVLPVRTWSGKSSRRLFSRRPGTDVDLVCHQLVFDLGLAISGLC